MTIVFNRGEGVTKDDVALFMEGSNLVFEYSEGDRVTITNQSYTNNAIEGHELSIGSYLTNTHIYWIVQ